MTAEADPDPEPSNASTANAYRYWALCDYWPLEDAVELVLADSPRMPDEPADADSLPHPARILNALALNCAGASLSVIQTDLRPDVLLVRPEKFLEWAEKRGVSISAALSEAVEQFDVTNRKEGNTGVLRAPQRHRERCRGIAQLLWTNNPNIRLKTMTKRREIRDIGCEGKSYSEATIRGWLQEVAPPEARKGGRPRNDET